MAINGYISAIDTEIATCYDEITKQYKKIAELEKEKSTQKKVVQSEGLYTYAEPVGTIDDAKDIVKLWLSESGYQHSLRVAEHVKTNAMIPAEYKNFCVIIAILHDLWEDSDYPRSLIKDAALFRALSLITKKPNVAYVDYIKEIKINAREDVVGQCVWWVKLADMQDHFAQADTLTPRLLQKYATALPYLL